jgi:hypothetical protein
MCLPCLHHVVENILAAVEVSVYHWTRQRENHAKHVILSSERIFSMFEKPKSLYSCIHICETCFERKMRVRESKGKTWNKQLKEHKSISAHCLFQYLRNGSTVNRQLVCPQMEEKKMCYLVRLVYSRLISLSFFWWPGLAFEWLFTLQPHGWPLVYQMSMIQLVPERSLECL